MLNTSGLWINLDLKNRGQNRWRNNYHRNYGRKLFKAEEWTKELYSILHKTIFKKTYTAGVVV